MRRLIYSVLFAFSAVIVASGLQGMSAHAQSKDLKRIALVVGIGAYQFQSLPASGAQDATLIANALGSQGFEVFGGRDLTQAQLVATLSDFKQKVEATRENNIVVAYFAGRFVQVANQNFFVPADYRPVEPINLGKIGVRISDLQNFLSSLAAKGHILFLDSGNSIPVALKGFKPVPGMATIMPVRNSVIGINTTPGLLGADFLDPVGPFARALAEAIQRGAGSWADFTNFARIRQLQLTNGDSIAFFSVANDRMALPFEPRQDAIKALRSVQQMPMKDSRNAAFAFTLALSRATPEALDEFNFIYPANTLVPRSKIILSAMREARIWTQVLSEDKPEAYWAYLKIYPRGGHSDEARYRLRMLKAPIKPPADAPMLVISNPPSSVDEATSVIRFSPIALDDERLRLQSAILPYAELIGSLEQTYIPKPTDLPPKSNDFPVLRGFETMSGRIQPAATAIPQ